MVSVPVQCPHCHSTEVMKAGKQTNGAQRYQCQNDRCARRIFLLEYHDRGRALEIRRLVVDIAINGSGIRDTARVRRRTATRQPRVVTSLSSTRRHHQPPTKARRRSG